MIQQAASWVVAALVLGFAFYGMLIGGAQVVCWLMCKEAEREAERFREDRAARELAEWDMHVEAEVERVILAAGGAPHTVEGT